VDHLSGFAHVACCHSNSAEEIGIKLVHIMSTSITPKILQSDNGTEFLGDNIKVLKQFYRYIHIVKEHTYYPHTQGKIERGHVAIKEALQKWTSQYGSNKDFGVFTVADDEINKWKQYKRGSYSA
jgi:hypothetical protein